jgi:hypothetical protein
MVIPTWFDLGPDYGVLELDRGGDGARPRS